MNDNNIYFISGSCGVGKTSVLSELKNNLSKELYDFHDLDERGYKSIEGWRLSELKFFKEQAEKNLEKGITTFISGFSRPAEVFDSLKENKHVTIILLHAEPETIRERIINRYPTEESKKAFFQKHNKTVEQFSDDNANYVTTFKKDFELSPTHIINTDNLSPKDVAEKIIDFIQK